MVSPEFVRSLGNLCNLSPYRFGRSRLYALPVRLGGLGVLLRWRLGGETVSEVFVHSPVMPAALITFPHCS